MIRTLAIAGLAAFVSSTALAQTTIHYREGQRVDPQDVARILGNPTPAAIRTRSIRMLDEPAVAESASDTPSALSLPVRFDFDSAEVSASASKQLDALAKGIKMLSPDRTIVIEGHTDAIGSDEYNRHLSRRRAASVKEYLVLVHGIEDRRLKDAGVGKQQPIDGLDPRAPQNRRVQFRGS